MQCANGQRKAPDSVLPLIEVTSNGTFTGNEQGCDISIWTLYTVVRKEVSNVLYY
jgi:hypothetical protein